MAQRELTWGQWLDQQEGAKDLIDPSSELAGRPWQPSDEDREGAWILYTELRTRITTQRLHYRSGGEETALKSLYDLFDLTRKTLGDKGPKCAHLATIAIRVLNTCIRPLTAKWHKKKIAGRLQNDDDRREFRHELQAVQVRLVVFCRLLASLAEGDSYLDVDSCGSVPGHGGAGTTDTIGQAIPFDRILLIDQVPGGADLLQAEVIAIRERRAEASPAPAKEPVADLVGLACSGGGIRSATFCLGVAQTLARHGILARVDYLSTVSGGGYFGAFLSSYLNDKDRQRVGLEPGKLPFAEAGRAEPAPIRRLRNNSKYLLKGGLLGQARMVGLMLFGVLVNLITVLPLVVSAVTLTKAALLLGATSDGFRGVVDTGLAVLLMLLLVMLLGLPIVYRRWASDRERVAGYEQAGIHVAVGLVGLGFLGWLLPSAYQAFEDTLGSPGAVLGLFGVLPFLFAGAAFAIGPACVAGRLCLVLAGVGGPLLLLMAYFVLEASVPDDLAWVLGLLALSATSIAWLRLINVNLISPHRYYRNRLAETYLLRRGEETAVDPQPLSGLGSDHPGAPYHLINAAVNLPASKEPGLRGRNSDFFLLSRHYCGSPLLGYCPTGALERKAPSLDLGTAMAVSGAAASSHMGTGTLKGAAFWLALLNLRLGYWLPNPRRLAEIPDGLGPRPFSLWHELLGRMDENGKFVNLSDGGHIENLGIYELLRRRCKFIIAIDGEADPDMTFPGLMTLIRYAQIDFGICIRLDLADLARNDAGYTKAHFALGTIDYGRDQTGYLLYIKSSLTGNERDYILDYRARHPAFPHETTADQFFNEPQFEAYRALGEHIGDDLFREELIGKGAQPTLEAWFGSLVSNLLEERIA
ncbi:hypothetical protein [Thiocapsa rosea]|uniref:Patatin-like phospholipase n=1 Tax=Thiocapsa rosea TaxID=69360 RepID=A0A495VFP0_9GAMM|nr:hypothetical protein [Thiocapsa rosea]RKT46638.1 patatin-like phospholipase [Thiocapsa rosea]